MRRWALPLLLAAAPAHAGLTEAQLAGVGAHPPVGARLPAVPLVDANGRTTTLAAVAGGRPLLLIFADYTCRHLCGPGLALTAGAIEGARLVPGRDVSLAVVGIDPKDGPAAAAAMADAQIGGDPALRRTAALLTGRPAAIASAERALGYRAVYDAASDQWAHDASVYVFAPDGRLAALLPETALRPDALRGAVVNRIAAPEPPVAHLCFGLGAVHGRYAEPIVWGLRAMALASLAAIGWGVRAWRAA